MSFEKTIFLPVTPDEAFALITQPERLRRWKTVAARIDLRIGGEYRWTMVPGSHAAGTFIEIEPGRRLAYTWGWEGDDALPPGASTVTVTLEEADGGTSVRLVHDGLSAEQEVGHAEGWNHFLGRLVDFTASGDAGADDWAATPDPANALVGAEAALAVAERVLAGLATSDMERQTACTDFTVAQLVEHLHGSVTHIGAALGLEIPMAEGADPEVRIADAAAAVLEAFARRGLEGTVTMGSAELPATIVASILNIEFLVHAWDLATATGQDITVADGLSDYVLGLARTTIAPDMRGKSFADETVVGESAASLDRLIAFTGRRVGV